MGTITVEIDVDDVIDQISDKQLTDEYKARELGLGDGNPRETVARAVAIIKTGRVDDGITMLEREFFPTWKDSDAAARAYLEAMSLKVAA